MTLSKSELMNDEYDAGRTGPGQRKNTGKTSKRLTFTGTWAGVEPPVALANDPCHAKMPISWCDMVPAGNPEATQQD